VRTHKLAVFAICTALLVSRLPAEDFVSKEEFQKLKAEVEQFQAFKIEFEKFRVQNERLVTENAQLLTEIKTVHAGKTAGIDNRLDQLASNSNAQFRGELNAVKSGSTKFLLTGSATASYMDHQGDPTTFGSEFDPVFLWKMSDRLSFEAETPITIDNNST